MPVQNLYMALNSREKRGKRKAEMILRTAAPYVATVVLVIVLFWGIDNFRSESMVREPWQPLVPQHTSKDWTQKLSLRKHDDFGRPDDTNEKQCPTPTGNWAHTCDRELTIEGPCKGLCLLKAHCQNLDGSFKETTFEFQEGVKQDIKNVNGLLCKLEKDGRTSCGLNFHGNTALKNCLGYVPRRHETSVDGLFAPLQDENNDKHLKKYNQDEVKDRDFDFEEEEKNDRYKPHEKRGVNNRGEVDTFNTRHEKRHRVFDDHELNVDKDLERDYEGETDIDHDRDVERYNNRGRNREYFRNDDRETDREHNKDHDWDHDRYADMDHERDFDHDKYVDRDYNREHYRDHDRETDRELDEDFDKDHVRDFEYDRYKGRDRFRDRDHDREVEKYRVRQDSHRKVEDNDFPQTSNREEREYKRGSERDYVKETNRHKEDRQQQKDRVYRKVVGNEKNTFEDNVQVDNVRNEGDVGSVNDESFDPDTEVHVKTENRIKRYNAKEKRKDAQKGFESEDIENTEMQVHNNMEDSSEGSSEDEENIEVYKKRRDFEKPKRSWQHGDESEENLRGLTRKMHPFKYVNYQPRSRRLRETDLGDENSMEI